MKIQYTQEQADQMLQEQKARAFDIAIGLLRQHFNRPEVALIALKQLGAGIAMTQNELSRLIQRKGN